MRTVSLGKLCKFTNGGTPSKKEPSFWTGHIPWITSAEINGGDVLSARFGITEEAVQRSAANVVHKGTLLLVIRTGVGKAAITSYKLAYNQDIVAVTPNRQLLDKRYLLRFINLNERYFDRHSRGATVKGVTRQTLCDLQIPLPPLAEQKRIAAILDQADALREKRRQAMAKLDELLQSVFFDMFGDPVTNPKRWEIAPLEAFADPLDRINYGVVQPGDDYPNGKPLVRVGDFKSGALNQESVKLIDPEIESKYSRSRLRGNELLISCVGSIGVICDVPTEAIGFNIARAVTRVPLKDVTIRPFLKECLKSPSPQRYFINKTRTVSQPTLNVSFVKETRILNPPHKMKQRFCEIAESTREQTSHQELSTLSLDTLFASLQQRAFKGKL